MMSKTRRLQSLASRSGFKKEVGITFVEVELGSMATGTERDTFEVKLTAGQWAILVENLRQLAYKSGIKCVLTKVKILRS